ncbi:hypothetical protein ACFV6F_09290 [Kitasatospora phosalacinea]|uniref:hypothetical protein n=1 Tax=Kitasatospora phosalacinea TaxID=2065 RepID=UPI003669EAA0
MSREQLTERFAAVADDGLVVASAFDHPERGRVECPAAPLVAAWLDAWGTPNRVGPLTGGRGAVGDAKGDGGLLVATTYPGPDGRPLGIAVLAPHLLAGTAAAAVSTWSACLRTRRLLVPVFAPRCDGTLTAPPGPGSPAPEDDCRPRSLAREAVLGQRAQARRVLLVGAPRAGTPDGLVPVPDVETATKIPLADPGTLAFVVAPCADTCAADRIVSVLRERFPSLRGQHPEQWCHRGTDNRIALEVAVHHGDLTLSLPGAPPPPPRARRVVEVRTLADLRPADIAQAATIVLLGPPGTPGSGPEPGTPEPGSGLGVAEVVGLLSGLGPTAVVRRGGPPPR